MLVTVLWGEKSKCIFPHELINDIFFEYNNILDIDLCLEKKHFYKRDHNELKNYEISNYNVKENLIKYAKNDTNITLKLYKELNKICHLILKCDMTAFNYETKGEYISYFERMLIANDEDKKLNQIKIYLEQIRLCMILNVQQKRIWDMFHILTI